MGKALFCFLSSIASSIIARISLTPELMALKLKNGRLSCLEIIKAKVVLPTPGGPQSNKEGMVPNSMALRNTPPLPTKCCWPM